jgi:cytochrome c
LIHLRLSDIYTLTRRAPEPGPEKTCRNKVMQYWYANCSIFRAGQGCKGLALKNYSGLLALVALATLFAGCGRNNDEAGKAADQAPLPTAATLGDQVVMTASEYLQLEPYASASPSRGEQQAQWCKACHSLEKGGPHMLGPALHGFFGTEVGTRAGFEYSAVMRNADFVWTPGAVDAWLAQPGRFLPGNRMTFAGVADPDDRNDLIAYLLEVTSADGTD